MAPEVIVWDFDGVVNRNFVDGRFVWADSLGADLGLDRASLERFIFGSGRMRGIVRGVEDLRDVVAEWLHLEGSEIGADALLSYWFAQDALPDAEVLGWIKALPYRHVIGTNNEARRAAYIETEMGFASRVEKVFASGRMGVAKPDAAYFEAIETWSGVVPARILLVDDSLQNVETVQARGWQGFHFTDATRDGFLAALEGS
ncbi:MAG: HAD family hydrolase [Pseudomonadota bacterium]